MKHLLLKDGQLIFCVFLIRWLQVAFIAICYMFIDVFALQHIADRPSVNIAINAHIAVLL